MINIWYKTIKSTRYSKIKSPRPGSWINVECATEDDLKTIADMISLDQFDVRDVLDPYEIPRIERKNNSVLLFVRTPKDESQTIHTETLCLILTNEYFITISPDTNKIIRKILKHKADIPTTHRAKLLVYLFLKIANEYTKNIKMVKNDVFGHRSTLLKISDYEIENLTINEEILNQYLSALVPTSNVFNQILSGKFINLFTDDEDMFSDAKIAIDQSVDVCKVDLTSISNLRDSYQIIFTNKLNRTMRKLTVVTIVLTIPTIISSLFGMNVRLPFEHHQAAFAIVLIIIGLICGSVIYMFNKNRWF